MVANYSPQFRLFGWQGIVLKVPEHWELAFYDGTWYSGNVMLDDGEKVCLRLQWKYHDAASIDLDKIQKLYRENYNKETAIDTIWKKEQFPVSAQFRKTHETRFFSWNSPSSLCGITEISYCKVCKRLLVCEIIASNNQYRQEIAPIIFSSLEDHAINGVTFWSVYGFVFELQDSYNLIRADFQAGKLLFLFQDKQSQWLHIERWSMAAQVLKKVTLYEWPEEWLRINKVPVRGIVEKDRGQINGRKGPAVWFHTHIPPDGFGKFFKKSRSLYGIIWYREHSDKLIAAMATDKEVLDAFFMSIR